MVTKKTGSPRGRPTKPIFEDPDRFTLAFAVALKELQRSSTFRQPLRDAILMLEGHAVRPNAKVLTQAANSGMAVYSMECRRLVVGSDGDFERVKSLRKKLSKLSRSIRKNKPDLLAVGAWIWMNYMVAAFAAVFAAGDPAEGETVIHSCCAFAKEAVYAEKLIALMHRRFRGDFIDVVAGLHDFATPDFIPHAQPPSM